MAISTRGAFKRGRSAAECHPATCTLRFTGERRYARTQKVR